jgi:dienelactone hydrolase
LLAGAVLLVLTQGGLGQEVPVEAVDIPGVDIPGVDIPGWGHAGTVAGKFAHPQGTGTKGPAVLILHSSAGVDGTGQFYATALQAAGIATLEIVMFPPRGRPAEGHQATIPHEAAALRWLSAQPSVDGARIGVLGFSWGGFDTVLLASDLVQERMGPEVPRPAAFAPLYPSCTNIARIVAQPNHPFYNAQTRMRAVPMLIQEGTRDDYEVGEHPCEQLIAMWPADAQERARVRYYEGATHAFEVPSPRRFQDQFAQGGRGGTVYVEPNPKAAAESRQAVVDFFVANLR